MDILRFSSIAEILEKNENIIISTVEAKSSGQDYFMLFTSSHISPGKIVTESFISLLKLSLRMGNTSPLIEQYLWTMDLLDSRGFGRANYVKGFSHYIDLVGGIIEKFINDSGINGSDKLLECKELFKLIEEEFVQTVKK